MFKFFFDILLLLIISWRFSAEASENFYQHQTWLKLSGYKRIADGWHSHIKNADYFIANNGSIDPAAELGAFIDLAERSRFNLEAAKIFCRYPARAAFSSNRKSLHIRQKIFALTQIAPV